MTKNRRVAIEFWTWFRDNYKLYTKLYIGQLINHTNLVTAMAKKFASKNKESGKVLLSWKSGGAGTYAYYCQYCYDKKWVEKCRELTKTVKYFRWPRNEEFCRNCPLRTSWWYCSPAIDKLSRGENKYGQMLEDEFLEECDYILSKLERK